MVGRIYTQPREKSGTKKLQVIAIAGGHPLDTPLANPPRLIRIASAHRDREAQAGGSPTAGNGRSDEGRLSWSPACTWSFVAILAPPRHTFCKKSSALSRYHHVWHLGPFRK
ncbi:Hypothetical predicted protein [Podarcis lilfordi]|uniref:Uncharacterized protein n=1 Tax=Podarcis lilfordi TaxID=74358 RepID=A0AA35L3U0_9SAUR|nr:Hypothetical predicted protein [Podarcis lilfordi]